MLVALGKGVYIGSKSQMGTGTFTCYPVFANRIVAVPLEDSGANVQVRLAWRKGERSKTVLSFLEMARYIIKSEVEMGSKPRAQKGDGALADRISRLRLRHPEERGGVSVQLRG